VDLFGSFSLLLAFLCALYAISAGIFGILKRRTLLLRSARNAGMAVCVLVWLAMGSLAFLFLSDNFSISYVVEHSNRTLPTLYKIAAIWSGQEGSLLFWSFILSLYVFSVLFAYRGKHPELMPYVGVTMASVQLFFLVLNAFISSPFKVLGAAGAGGVMDFVVRADGRGLTPLLQYPEMVIHPPVLYAGYTGFTIPFAFALAALLGRYPGEKWIHLTRSWTMIAWCFQSAGVLLGAHWAYAVLGWGGYWMWDPVENASLLPWLTGTAFLHSVMMQEKRGMMKVWNVWLVFATFLLTIFGTFLTRSGVVSSVHAFSQSTIGPWFLGFLIVGLAICFAAYWRNRDYLRGNNRLDSLVSRESSFLFNNLILLVACVAVLAGTLFPVLSEWVQGQQIAVGPPFFNAINIPIGLLLLFLTGVGPLLAWRKTSLASLKRNFGLPALVGLVAGIAGVALGLRNFYVTVCLILCVFVTLTILLEFYRGARVISARTGANLFSSVSQLTLRNTRRYGGYVIHFGMVLIFMGVAGSAFNQDTQTNLPVGAQMEIGPYTLTHQTFDTVPSTNYTAQRATIAVDRDGEQVIMLYPERRFYPSNEESGTLVAIYSTLREDLYVVYNGLSPDTQQPVIHAYINPLVKWIWLGGVIVVLGTILALVPNRQAVLAIQPAAKESFAQPRGAPSPAHVALEKRGESHD
jgi:cytochrome c-type biogenesis protein CcmF